MSATVIVLPNIRVPSIKDAELRPLVVRLGPNALASLERIAALYWDGDTVTCASEMLTHAVCQAGRRPKP